jgi:glycosyltransferase involved in cell wall biosynthesis
MNILHVIAGLDPTSGGTTTALRNILQMETILGIDHEVLTIKRGPSDPSIYEMVRIYSASPSFPARYSRSPDSVLWLERNLPRFDLFFIHGIWSWLPWKISLVLTARKKPFIISPHGSLDPFDLKKKKIAKMLLGPLCIRGMLSRASAVLCTARREAQLIECYGANPCLEVLPLPVPYRMNKSSGQEFRERYGFTEQDFIFLFLSRINYKKGLDILIPAFRMLVDEFPNARLVIAGSDREGYSDRVREWIAERDLESRIIFPGFLTGDEKEQAFSGSNCFVLPSLNENFALSAVEALAAGLPVIISENVYICEEVIEANAGWVCKYSEESLFGEMRRAVTDPGVFSDRKKKAVDLAVSYSPETVGKKYMNLYHKLLHK